jgi:integrase
VAIKSNKGTGIEWHGFHVLRRGLGTRLFNNGVPIETASRILRHGSVHVTRAHYVDVLDATVVNALEGCPGNFPAIKTVGVGSPAG